MLNWLHRIPWPLPPLLVWLLGWGSYGVLVQAGQGPGTAAVLISLGGCLAARWGQSRGRRLIIGLGFPLSWLWLADWATLAAPLWLLPLAVFLLLYPPSAWRLHDPAAEPDFGDLRPHLELPPMARIVVAVLPGPATGPRQPQRRRQPLGPLLRALERTFPDARCTGLCPSWADWLLAHLSGSQAQLLRADPWQSDWSACDLLLLVLPQAAPPPRSAAAPGASKPSSASPLTEANAADPNSAYAVEQQADTHAALNAALKAASELPPGAWLASLGQALPGCQPSLEWPCPQGGTLWLYQAPWPSSPAASQRPISASAGSGRP